MKDLRIRCALMLGVALLVHPAGLAGQSIRGVVVESGTGQPVSLASVLMFTAAGDSVAAALTDSTGFFSLRAPEDEFALRITGLGYRTERAGPFTLSSRDAVRVIEIALDPQPISIEGVSVDARLPALAEAGFYERMAEGRGQFLTPTDIAESDAWFTPELFHDLDHVRPQYSAAPWARWVSLTSATGSGLCEPRVFIDGVWLRPEFRRPGEGLDDAVPLEDLLAAEVYWGPFQAAFRFVPLVWLLLVVPAPLCAQRADGIVLTPRLGLVGYGADLGEVPAGGDGLLEVGRGGEAPLIGFSIRYMLDNGWELEGSLLRATPSFTPSVLAFRWIPPTESETSASLLTGV